MAGTGIFLSWSEPDLVPLDSLKKQLQSLGFPLWEYRDGVAPGQKIHDTVVDAIQASLATIVCFSDATADREWLKREIDYAFVAYGKDVRRILPVWIGPHPEKRRAAIIDEYGIAIGDLTSQEDREKFVTETLPSILNLPAPLVVPAALFAMDAKQSAALFEKIDEGTLDGPELLSLCKSLGMSSPPELLKEWSGRYGENVDDFSPFAGKQRLIDIVQAAVDEANKIRLRDRHRPIAVRWLHDELAGKKGGGAKTAARLKWLAGRPLLIVDSISTLEKDFLNVIDKLPNDQSSILWIPPYTLHTNALETLLRKSAGQVEKINDAFSLWEQPEQPQLRPPEVAFDAPTSLSVRRWLHRTFVDLRDENEPLAPRVSSVENEIQGPKSLKSLTTRPANVPSAFAS